MKWEGDDELEVRIWKEAVIGYTKVLSRNSPGGLRKDTKSKSQLACNMAEIQMRYSRIQV
jgi:hypothetical protein